MAARIVGIKDVVIVDDLMAQPPYQTALEFKKGSPYYLIHYTYGLDYNKSGVMLPRTVGEWHFDKRAQATPIPRNMSEPFATVNSSIVRKLIQ
eukprot:gene5855-6147_t